MCGMPGRQIPSSRDFGRRPRRCSSGARRRRNNAGGRLSSHRRVWTAHVALRCHTLRVSWCSFLGRRCRSGCRSSDRDQHVAESLRRGVPDTRLVLAAHHGHHPDASSLAVAVPGKRHGVDALLGWSTDQFRPIYSHRIQPGCLARHVPVMALLDMTGPASEVIGLDPAACGRRRRQPEILPSARVRRMLDHATVVAHSRQRGGETSAILAKAVLVRLARRAVK
jgi:hypothetical protein